MPGPDEVVSASGESALYRVLRVFAPVERGEALTALLLLVNVFVLLTSYYVLKVIREPLILAGGGAELKAYASGGQAILLLLVVPAFGFLASRVTRVRLLTVMQVIFMSCLLAFYVLAKAGAPVGLAFYLWLGVYNMFVISNFWSFANDVYTPDQGKRLFPIIGVGGSLGAILGARAPEWLQSVFGIEELMLVVAGALGVSIVIYRLVDRRERNETDARHTVSVVKPEAVRPVERDGGFKLVLSDRYLRLMAVMVMLMSLVNTSGEYVISRMATEQSAVVAAEAAAAAPADTPPDQRAAIAKSAEKTYIKGFFSDYYSIVNLVVFLFQLLAVARLIQLLGIRRALYVMPVVALVGWIGFIGVATLAWLRISKTSENAVDYSLQNTVRQALYLPTSRASKYKAKAAIDTFFIRTADAVSGLLLVPVLVSALDLGVRAFAIINVLLIAIWLVVARTVGHLHDQRAAERAQRAALGLRETAPT